MQVQLWSEIRGRVEPIFVTVPEDEAEFLESAKKEGIGIKILAEHLEDVLDQEMRSLESRSATGDEDNFKSLEQTENYLKALDGKHQEMRLEIIGTTFEKRSIYVVKIVKDAKMSWPKKAVLIDCGTHAREWISHAICLKLIKGFLKEPIDQQSIYKKLIEKFDFHLIPVVNPDGYAYTWTHNRMWRKNRAIHGDCMGVDINRNFDACFKQKYDCGDDAPGPYPHSETETKAYVDYSTKISKNLVGAFTIHSYGQLLIHPYASTSYPSPSYETFWKAGKEAVGRIKEGKNTVYTQGQTAILLCKSD